jgi:predicted RNase H-like nuclease (RuvC/YqgF family)
MDLGYAVLGDLEIGEKMSDSLRSNVVIISGSPISEVKPQEDELEILNLPYYEVAAQVRQAKREEAECERIDAAREELAAHKSKNLSVQEEIDELRMSLSILKSELWEAISGLRRKIKNRSR